MTKAEFLVVMAYLETACGKKVEVKAFDVYFDLLGDLPAEVLQVAAKRVALEHPWATFPSIAELRTASSEISNVQPPTWGEAWQIAMKAVKFQLPYNGPRLGTPEALERERMEAALANVPPAVRCAIECFGWQALCDVTEPEYAREQFRKIYEPLAVREKRAGLLPAPLRTMIGQLGMMPKEITHA